MNRILIGILFLWFLISGQVFSTDFQSMVRLIDSSYEVRSAALDVEQSRVGL